MTEHSADSWKQREDEEIRLGLKCGLEPAAAVMAAHWRIYFLKHPEEVPPVERFDDELVEKDGVPLGVGSEHPLDLDDEGHGTPTWTDPEVE